MAWHVDKPKHAISMVQYFMISVQHSGAVEGKKGRIGILV